MLKMRIMFIGLWCTFSCGMAFSMKHEKEKNTISQSTVKYNEVSTNLLKELMAKVSYYHMFRNIDYIKKVDRTILQNDTIIKDIECLLKKGANPNIHGVPLAKTLLQVMLTILVKNELPEQEIKRVNFMTQLLILYGAKGEMNLKYFLAHKKELKCLLRILSTMALSKNPK